MFRAEIGDVPISSDIDRSAILQSNRVGLGLLMAKEAGLDEVAWREFAGQTPGTFFTPCEKVGAELLRHGLTFDLIANDIRIKPSDFPAMHLIDLKDGNAELDFDVINLLPGPHINAGIRALPIVRGFMELARDIVLYFPAVKAVYWPPAQAIIGRQYFESSISAWLEQGVFPARGLVEFVEIDDKISRTRGLRYFIGQELEAKTSQVLGSGGVFSAGARLVNQLILNGPVNQQQSIITYDGQTLSLHPAQAGQKILVR